MHRHPETEQPNPDLHRTHLSNNPVLAPRFGIWQLTTSFHIPASLGSVLCTEELPRVKRSKIPHPPSDLGKEEAGLFKRLASAEARLRAAFAPNGAGQVLTPIYHEQIGTEDLAQSVCRQSVPLLCEAPFEWLSATMKTSFTFKRLGTDLFFNDFLLSSMNTGHSAHHAALNTARFNVAAILADRRSHMLGQGLSERVYNLFFPSAIVHETLDASRSYILVPLLSCVRLSGSSCFRRTLSLSLMLIPVSEKHCTERSMNTAEVESLQSGWTLNAQPGETLYTLRSGELTDALRNDPNDPHLGENRGNSLRGIIENVFAAIISKTDATRLSGNRKASRSQIRALVVRSVQASICGGYCAVVPDLTVLELKKWQANPINEADVDDKLRLAFARLLGDRISSEWVLSKPSSFRLDHGRGAEQLIPTFYFSFGLQRLLFTPTAADLESQHTSILWASGWHLLLLTGISALLEMLDTFHHEMERRQTAISAQAFLKEFLVDIEEYFDFGLLPVYRLDFDALKKIEGIDHDFERLRERVMALGQERIIDENRTTNQRLLWIAALSLLVSIAVLALAFKPTTSQNDMSHPSSCGVMPQKTRESNAASVPCSIQRGDQSSKK